MSLPLLTPRLFAAMDGVVGGFTTRHGGVSQAPYTSLNLGMSSGDEPMAVEENRRRLLAHLSFAPDALALAGQVHGADVRTVTEGGLHRRCDALVTTRPGLLLGIIAADCAPIILADPEARVVGACHSGWRGTRANVVWETVRTMMDLGAEPKTIRAAIGPCISAEQFEVGEEVAEQFDDAFVVRRAEWPKPHVDLRKVLLTQLHEAGVHTWNTEVDLHCTVQDNADFFSYRKEGKQSGRLLGFVGMRA
jgi:YfiH family protein